MTPLALTLLIERLRTNSGWYVGDERARDILGKEFARLEGERNQVEQKLNDALVELHRYQSIERGETPPP